MSADETRQSVLTSDEKDHLWATWMRGGGLASDDSRFWIEVDKIIVARVAERIAEALRDAADAALTMYDPPVEECITWSEWLRARADYRRIRPDIAAHDRHRRRGDDVSGGTGTSRRSPNNFFGDPMNSKTTATIAATLFVACILAANYVTTNYGLVTVGFGLVATAGTYFAGATFVLRDTVQDGLGKWAVLALIIIGAGLSYFISAPFIATASGVAFLCSETADLAIYTPLRERGYIRAAIASNIVGAVVDTFLFLWIAGFGITRGVVEGQLVGKLVITLAVVALVVLVRGARKAVPA